jgi:hypothetical protein
MHLFNAGTKTRYIPKNGRMWAEALSLLSPFSVPKTCGTRLRVLRIFPLKSLYSTGLQGKILSAQALLLYHSVFRQFHVFFLFFSDLSSTRGVSPSTLNSLRVITAVLQIPLSDGSQIPLSDGSQSPFTLAVISVNNSTVIFSSPPSNSVCVSLFHLTYGTYFFLLFSLNISIIYKFCFRNKPILRSPTKIL